MCIKRVEKDPKYSKKFFTLRKIYPSSYMNYQEKVHGFTRTFSCEKHLVIHLSFYKKILHSLYKCECITFSQEFMNFRYDIFPTLLFFLGGILLWVGVSRIYTPVKIPSTNTHTSSTLSAGTVIPSSDFSQLIDPRIESAYDILSKNYYHFSEYKKSDIQDGIIRGLVDSLDDKHSEYMNTEETLEFNQQLAWDLEGIGAVVDTYDNGVIVEHIIEKSPAEEAWLGVGDIILSANGTSFRDMKASEAVKFIRGPANSRVDLMVQEKWVGEEKIVSIIRRKILIPSVYTDFFTGTTSTGGIAYINLALFGEHTGEEFEKSLVQILEKKPAWIILDLRENGGWFLDVAVDILSHFFPKDTALVTTKENDPNNNVTLFSYGSSTFVTLPVVLLINSRTASASEIVAGAFQDYKKGIVIGETSYGKGSVQQPFILSDGSELKITVARWFTPLDRGIDGKGIAPDYRVRMTLEDYDTKFDRQLDEAKKVLKVWIENTSREATLTAFSGSIHTWEKIE